MWNPRSQPSQSSILVGGEGGRDRRRDPGRFCEAAALASIGEREGENDEEDSESGLYRGCWKIVFTIFFKFYR